MKHWITAVVFVLLTQTIFAQFNLYLEHRIQIDTEEINIMKISPNGRFLAFGDKRGNLTIWDIEASRRIHQIQSRHKSVLALVFDRRNRRLILRGQDRRHEFG